MAGRAQQIEVKILHRRCHAHSLAAALLPGINPALRLVKLAE